MLCISCYGCLVKADSVSQISGADFNILDGDSLSYKGVFVFTVVDGSLDGFGTFVVNDEQGVFYCNSLSVGNLSVTVPSGFVVTVNNVRFYSGQVFGFGVEPFTIRWNLGNVPTDYVPENDGGAPFVLLFMVVGAVLAVGFGLFETVEKHKEVGVLIAVVGFILFVVFLFAIGVL